MNQLTCGIAAGVVAMMGLAAALGAGEGAEPGTSAPAAATQPAGDDRAGVAVRVARFMYGRGGAGVVESPEDACFSAGFLAAVDRESRVRAHREFDVVDLGSEAVFNHPFAVMTGSRSFTLSAAETASLKAYLSRGGFLLASASCSNEAWAASFRSTIRAMFPDAALKVLPLAHPMFRSLYKIDAVVAKQATGDLAIYGLEVGGRLAVVFSPLGLNDTANAGGGCCCCGGNEIREASQINANALVYALTH